MVNEILTPKYIGKSTHIPIRVESIKLKINILKSFGQCNILIFGTSELTSF